MKKRKNNRKPRLQHLAKRDLFAGDISFSGGVLEIDGTNGSDRAYVSYVQNRVKAHINGRSVRFSKSQVKEIIFRGYGDNDAFDNNTAIPSTAYGHGGNDQLYGGSGRDYLSGGDGNDKIFGGSSNDTIYGGDGKDRLYGGSGVDVIFGGNQNDQLYGGLGNDRLYGGSGNDHLEGQSGNDKLYGQSGHDDLYGHGGTDYLSGGSGRDGLYGGGSTSKDTLRGGADADRFITQRGDTIKDYSSRDDARLHFVNGSARWNNAEIQTADKAFRTLHHKTRNTKLLRDNFTKKSLTFSKESDTWMNKHYSKNTLGVNSTDHSKWKTKSWNRVKFKWNHHHHERRTRVIRLRDWNNSRSSERDLAIHAVIHEIAHNWDASRPGESHSQWNKFKKLHDKSKSSDFVGSYAKTSAREDWSETFTHYAQHGKSSSNTVVRKKLAAVDAFFKSMA